MLAGALDLLRLAAEIGPKPRAHRVAGLTRFVLSLAMLLGCADAARAQMVGPGQKVTEVRILGNETVDEDDIRAQIRTRAGRDYDERLLGDDVGRLMGQRWFSDVRTFYKKDPERGGLIVTFQVTEIPVLREVEFRGMTKLKKKEVEESTGLKAGARAEDVKAHMAVGQIKRMYEDKGYEWAEVRLLEGGKPGDRRAIFEIFEGPKCRLRSIDFVGNEYVSAAVLATKIRSKTAILGFGGTYHRDEIESDSKKLHDYYWEQGFFLNNVKAVVRPDPNMGDLRVQFVVSEGIQHKVRKIDFQGNKSLDEAQLRAGLVLHSGKPFRADLRDADIKSLQEKYGRIGCIDAEVEMVERYADPEKEPGVVDLVYRIKEGVPYRIGRLIVKGNERTLDPVIRREANMAGVVPGEPIDALRIEKFKQRLANLRYFEVPGQGNKPIDVQIANRRAPGQPFGVAVDADLETIIRARMQSPGFDDLTGGAEAKPPARVVARSDPFDAPEPAPPAPVRSIGRARARFDEPLAPDDGPARVAQVPEDGPRGFDPAPDAPISTPPIVAPPPEAMPRVQPLVPPRTGEGVRTPPYGADVAPGGFPSLPGTNMTDVGPDRQEPFPDRSYADIITSVNEIATGRLMFGVGASSFGGLSGSVILHETNFDLFNLPRNLDDFTSGRAFRGRGQEFRVELSPGTSINRAVVSFRDPYVFNLPIGFGVSGYALSRFYPDWNEDRLGGRFSLGRQFGTMTYADVAFRVEDVNVYGYKFPAPAEYLAVSGHTTLATLRPSLRFDNRNDPFSPSRGSYLEFAFEQGWGTFTFPKATIEGRSHWTTGSRPDGSGKRVLTVRGFFGATGPDTPLYEKFYAGNFRSLRGFAYRGVGPFVFNSNIGGVMTLLGSVEWQFPWTANDRFQQVVFADFGTVENSYTIENFRVAVGTGLRIYLPQQFLGPLPLSFDVGFPIVKTPADREQIFAFFMGTFW